MEDGRRCYDGLISTLNHNEILVFGSNPQGWHGKGLAKIAKEQFGAIQGKGRGLQGQSYGLITKNMKKDYTEKLSDGKKIKYRQIGYKSLSKQDIIKNIKELYNTAITNQHLIFL